MSKKKSRPPVCPYCQSTATLVTGAQMYPHRPDLADRHIWRCPTCPDSYVGCHPGTKSPLGRLADKTLRDAKVEAHAAFDRLWQAKIRRDGCGKGVARRAAYAWLSAQLGTAPEKTHIGMFDAELCKRVVEVCRPFHAERRQPAAAEG